jgi:hypothetical protein
MRRTRRCVCGTHSTSIGGGDWAYAWGHQDDAASIAAIRHAARSA